MKQADKIIISWFDKTRFDKLDCRQDNTYVVTYLALISVDKPSYNQYLTFMEYFYFFF